MNKNDTLTSKQLTEAMEFLTGFYHDLEMLNQNCSDQKSFASQVKKLMNRKRPEQFDALYSAFWSGESLRLDIVSNSKITNGIEKLQ